MTHLVDEFGLVPALVEDVLGHGIQPHGVGRGLGADEEIGAARHLVLAKVGDDEALAAMFVGALDARGQHRMAFRGVRTDDDDQVGIFNVGDGTGVAAVADGALQSHGGRGLAVARAVVDVVGADDRARQLLHQVALFVGAFRRGDEGQRIGSMTFLDFGEGLGDQGQGFVPGGFAKGGAVVGRLDANQRRDQPVFRIDKVPCELAFDAGGDAIGGAFGGLDLEDVAVARPHVEGAADAAIGAHRLGAADARFAHGGLGVRDRQDGAEAGFRLDGLDRVDHVVERFAREDW